MIKSLLKTKISISIPLLSIALLLLPGCGGCCKGKKRCETVIVEKVAPETVIVDSTSDDDDEDDDEVEEILKAPKVFPTVKSVDKTFSTNDVDEDDIYEDDEFDDDEDDDMPVKGGLKK